MADEETDEQKKLLANDTVTDTQKTAQAAAAGTNQVTPGTSTPNYASIRMPTPINAQPTAAPSPGGAPEAALPAAPEAPRPPPTNTPEGRADYIAQTERGIQQTRLANAQAVLPGGGPLVKGAPPVTIQPQTFKASQGVGVPALLAQRELEVNGPGTTQNGTPLPSRFQHPELFQAQGPRKLGQSAIEAQGIVMHQNAVANYDTIRNAVRATTPGTGEQNPATAFDQHNATWEGIQAHIGPEGRAELAPEINRDYFATMSPAARQGYDEAVEREQQKHEFALKAQQELLKKQVFMTLAELEGNEGMLKAREASLAAIGQNEKAKRTADYTALGEAWRPGGGARTAAEGRSGIRMGEKAADYARAAPARALAEQRENRAEARQTAQEAKAQRAQDIQERHSAWTEYAQAHKETIESRKYFDSLNKATNAPGYIKGHTDEERDAFRQAQKALQDAQAREYETEANYKAHGGFMNRTGPNKEVHAGPAEIKAIDAWNAWFDAHQNNQGQVNAKDMQKEGNRLLAAIPKTHRPPANHLWHVDYTGEAEAPGTPTGQPLPGPEGITRDQYGNKVQKGRRSEGMGAEDQYKKSEEMTPAQREARMNELQSELDKMKATATPAQKRGGPQARQAALKKEAKEGA